MLVTGIALFSLAAGLATASPFNMDGWKVHSREVVTTETNLADMKYFAEWAGSSYCNSDNASGHLVACGTGACETLETNGASVFGSVSADTATAMKGFVGVDPVRGEIVVALKGSNSYRNWLASTKGWLERCDSLAPGCKVHLGFHYAWKDIRAATFEYVHAARAAHPTYRVVVAGHSLGGAVAIIAAAYLRRSGIPCDLYAFGSPRIGNQQFVDLLSSSNGTMGQNYRVTHTSDPVSRMPPNSWIFGGYRHISPEYWLGVDTADATLADVTVCEGSNNDSCNSGTSGYNATAHIWYLGAIASCAPLKLSWK